MKLYLLIPFIALASCTNENSEKKITEAIPKTEVHYDEAIDNSIELGAKLFFDPILSEDKTISCASCHNPKYAYADNSSFSSGVRGQLGTRNTPSVMNMASREFFFHDGRASTLEQQASGPVENPVEMNLKFSEAVKRVQENGAYNHYFNKIYGTIPDSVSIVTALADFQKSLESDGSAPHDLWMNDEDPNALDSSQIRGRVLFLTKANCFDCHFGPDFTTDQFRNIGLYDGGKLNDVGRFGVTKDSSDLGKFKVPGLRNTALTAPYMHNGMFETLEEVVDYYDNPYDFVEKPINIDSIMLEPLNLTDEEKMDLVHFMESLTDTIIPYFKDGLKVN